MNEPLSSPARGPAPRPGGRSARVQAAIHQAVRDLQQEGARDALSVPAIAARAGVTPSTIYRRWGDLSQLLADVAVEQLRPETSPADTGDFRDDLRAWLEQYLDEMSSGPGRMLLSDLLGTPVREKACSCAFYMRQQIEAIRTRALARGESPLEMDVIIDRIVSPMMYRVLFDDRPPTPADIERWLEGAIAER